MKRGPAATPLRAEAVAFTAAVAGVCISGAAAHESCCSASNTNHAVEGSEHSLAGAFLSKASEACPWLLLGLLTTAALEQARFPADAVRALLVGRGSNAKQRSAGLGALLANLASSARTCLASALLGLATPLCSCGALPLAVSLSAAGAPPQAVVAFLTAAQSAGLDSAAITLGVLGPRVAAFRLAGSVVLALAAGAAVGAAAITTTAAVSPSPVEAASPQAACCAAPGPCCTTAPDGPPARRLWASARRFLSTLASLFDEVWVMLALGTLATVLIEREWRPGSSNAGGAGHAHPLPFDLPLLAMGTDAAESTLDARPEFWDDEEDGLWEASGSSGPDVPLGGDWLRDLILRAAVVLGALPLQLCEHGVVSFAAALHKAGVTPGTAHAFLLSAPATNLSTLGVLLRNAGGMGSALRSVAAIAAAALMLSYVADHWSELLAGPDGTLGPPSAGFAPPHWFTETSVPICAVLMAVSLCRRAAIVTQGLHPLICRAHAGAGPRPRERACNTSKED